MQLHHLADNQQGWGTEGLRKLWKCLQSTQAPALAFKRGILCQGDRRMWAAPMLNQGLGNMAAIGHGHVEHQRTGGIRQGGPVQFQSLVVAQVPGDKAHTAGQPAMGQGNA